MNNQNNTNEKKSMTTRDWISIGCIVVMAAAGIWGINSVTKK